MDPWASGTSMRPDISRESQATVLRITGCDPPISSHHLCLRLIPQSTNAAGSRTERYVSWNMAARPSWLEGSTAQGQTGMDCRSIAEQTHSPSPPPGVQNERESHKCIVSTWMSALEYLLSWARGAEESNESLFCLVRLFGFFTNVSSVSFPPDVLDYERERKK